MPDFGAGVLGLQATRLHRYLPLAVTGAPQLHPEAMRASSIASGLDLQAVGLEAGAQSLDVIIGQPGVALLRLLIETVARRRHSLLQRAIQPLLFEMVDRSLSLQGRQRTAGYQLSLALARVGQTEVAQKVLAEVRRRQDVEVFAEPVKTQPDNLDLHVRLAESLLNDGHTKDGLGLMQTVLSRAPSFPPAHRVLADYFEKQGDSARAAQHRKLAGGTP